MQTRKHDTAFPIPDVGKDFEEGLTKREWFAGLALQAWVTHADHGAFENPNDFSQSAVIFADALIRALNRTESEGDRPPSKSVLEFIRDAEPQSQPLSKEILALLRLINEIESSEQEQLVKEICWAAKMLAKASLEDPIDMSLIDEEIEAIAPIDQTTAE